MFFEAFMRIFGPILPAAITQGVLLAFDKHPGVAGFLLIWLIWIVLINGGILILDDSDFNFLD